MTSLDQCFYITGLAKDDQPETTNIVIVQIFDKEEKCKKMQKI